MKTHKKLPKVKTEKIEPVEIRGLVIGIDPGVSGAIVITNGKDYFRHFPMPTETDGKDTRVSFAGLLSIAQQLREVDAPVFVERALPMAQGMKQAFNYGRGFEALIIALVTSGLPYTLVEPQKWAKEMHEGISTDLKAKAKSLVAVKRLYPQLLCKLPIKSKGGIHDGPIDALLIAGYGLRKKSLYEPPEHVNFRSIVTPLEEEDFY